MILFPQHLKETLSHPMDVTVFGVIMVLHETRFHPIDVTVHDTRYCVIVQSSFRGSVWRRSIFSVYAIAVVSWYDRVIQLSAFPLVVNVQPQTPELLSGAK